MYILMVPDSAMPYVLPEIRWGKVVHTMWLDYGMDCQ